VPMEINVKLASALADIAAKVSFIETKQDKPSLTITGNISLKKIALHDEHDKLC